jgi:hypothetical protein
VHLADHWMVEHHVAWDLIGEHPIDAQTHAQSRALKSRGLPHELALLGSSVQHRWLSQDSGDSVKSTLGPTSQR